MVITRRMFTPSRGWKSPFDEFDEMRTRMENMARFFTHEQRNAGVYPLLNVSEDKDVYRVRAELPGINASDLDISITGNKLAISGERKIEAEDQKAKYHRREREAGKFSRIIKLPDQVEVENVDAQIIDGVLLITLPKAASTKPRQIKIN